MNRNFEPGRFYPVIFCGAKDMAQCIGINNKFIILDSTLLLNEKDFDWIAKKPLEKKLWRKR